ncbi:MAG: thiosulfate oxidation carrier protein SoxY [Planktomarina sp.]|jgi:sulfur-oxidizing protein SoxY|nr:thiosulfate oxidation carrier protein SoxY [Planktomarina sp.]MDT2056531.1 thiosulfate oxidation carrier protein SoxY [Planktomarina sp.]HAJ84562.1 thiosulfate oxidation carrier protein SoxY [Paracoccaceae bacterium]|tara:strand:+ start:1132 stop:1554 length:423 start_codon:yes stop_codon:yes gene_type:complete
MDFTRRNILALGSGAFAVATFTGMPAFASKTDDAIAAFTGGADVTEGGIDLTAPEIAENGNTVPVAVSAPGAVSIMLLATGNPTPSVATFNFGPLAGARRGSTRIRLSKTQDVVAIAKMEDGTFYRAGATVKVTIGGCGG